MAPQLYLITPATAQAESFPASLAAVLDAAEFSAILVHRGAQDDIAYAQLVKAVIKVGQGAGCAVLVQDDVALAKRMGADGVHVTGDAKAVKAAIAALKPGLIVGAGPITTRHDAMTVGELDIDYLQFGNLDDAPDATAVELTEWWAPTFEIPAVLHAPGATDAHGAEFFACGPALWSAASPQEAARALAASLEDAQ